MCLLAVLLAPTVLSAQTLHGTWCGGGETLHLDAFGVGANEQTICGASPPPPEAGVTYTATLSCKNVYPGAQNADGTFEVIEVPLENGPTRITAMLTEGGQLSVLFDTASAAKLLDRCD